MLERLAASTLLLSLEAQPNQLNGCITIVVAALQASDLRKRSALFDLDKQWSREPNFVLYDFNNPEDIPVNIHNTFDCIVIDPPFITEEVWTLYAAAAKLLLAPGGGCEWCNTMFTPCKSWVSHVLPERKSRRHQLPCCYASHILTSALCSKL